MIASGWRAPHRLNTDDLSATCEPRHHVMAGLLLCLKVRAAARTGNGGFVWLRRVPGSVGGGLTPCRPGWRGPGPAPRPHARIRRPGGTAGRAPPYNGAKRRRPPPAKRHPLQESGGRTASVWALSCVNGSYSLCHLRDHPAYAPHPSSEVVSG